MMRVQELRGHRGPGALLVLVGLTGVVSRSGPAVGPYM